MTEAPTVVIGSGPCGAIAAAQLVSRGLDVVMLDAGLRPPKGLLVRAAGNILVRRMGWTEYATDRHDPASHAHVDWISSLSLGGLSNYWTGAVPRFSPEDFSDGARLDERFQWPITYQDLERYYEIAERHLTVTAGDPILGVPSNIKRFDWRLPADWREIVATAQRHGHGIGAMPLAKGHPWMAVRRGTEFDSYHCVVRPMTRSARFRLVSGAHVSRLNWSAAAGGVDAIEYFDRTSNRLERLPVRAVVVAAGAIDSTVLLLRSTSADFPNGLGNTAGLVGRYLHDHPREWWPAISDRRLTALAHPVYIARAPYRDSEPLLASSLTLGLAARRDRIRTYGRLAAWKFGVQVFGTIVPTDDVGVALGGPPDAHPLARRPVISLSYDRPARENMESARTRLHEVFGAAGITLTLPGPFYELRPGSSVHYGGTVRMHRDRAFGVLDGRNRIYDVPNVAVCDASCFTTGPEKNPTLTAMAIAARAADRLADDLGADKHIMSRIGRDAV